MFFASLIAATLVIPIADSCAAPRGREVPVDVITGRFFGRWQLQAGGELRFYLDTGGGTSMVYPGAIRRLGLAVDSEVTNGDTVMTARLPRSIGTAAFPAIPGDDPATLHLYTPPAVLEGQVTARMEEDNGVRVDGMLSRTWFADRIWTFDYPGARLLTNSPEDIAAIPARCWRPVGFQVDASGARTSHWPRITVRIDGDSVDLLFDTGAMTTLTDSARLVAEPGLPARRATSFITHQRLEQWRTRHPDWTVITRAEVRTGFRMIRVPDVEIGGARVGPVWFTERPDNAFHGFMSEWMDRRIDGALGGSALRELTIVLDYPRSRVAVIRTAR